MSRLLPKYLAEIRTRHGGSTIRVFCESGTFHGKTTRMACLQFPIVHTIELHPEWYAEAVRDLSPLGIAVHQGNSAEIIPTLAEGLLEPVVWYLDAHWFKLVPDVAGEQEGLPLFDELRAIAARAYPDIIVIDDVSLFGTTDLPGWAEVTPEKIAALFPGHREAAVLHDQFCVWR